MTTPAVTFTVALLSEGAMSAIPIAFDPRAVFGKARPPVVVTINGYSYRSTIAIMSGETFVPLRQSHRKAAGVEQGGTYEVTLTLDTAPREVDPPADLAEAMAAAGVREKWDALSFTAKREDAEAVEGAKRAETRERRIAAIVKRLGATLKRVLDRTKSDPCARSTCTRRRPTCRSW